MSEAKDPAIKLFGKTIPLPEIYPGATSTDYDNNNNIITSSSSSLDGGRVDEDNSALDQDRPSCASSCQEETDINPRRGDGEEGGETDKDTVEGKLTECNQENDDPPATEGESSDPHGASGTSENSENPSAEKENTTSEASKTGDDQNETNNSQEKTLKKPDKILPCPRCNSMDTKFCYYNNYNVNQPRHFCKNCQRYWTAGGTMRNVPVGAGRRKNKNSATHYRHITVPEVLQNVRTDVPNGVHPPLKANGTVLTFGSDIPLDESMASVLNLTDKTLRNGQRNGFHNLEPLAIPVSYEGEKNGNDHSSRSLVTETSSKDETGKSGPQEAVIQSYHGFPPRLPCFPGAPWAYPWNSAQWSSHVPPGFCPPGFAMPIFPAATYWGCTVPGPWNIPWLAPPSSPKQSVRSSGPNSPTLGKHSRDENRVKLSDSGEDELIKDNNSERCLWIPKTLRIDDPEEAAKSSIWATLGIKNDKPDLTGGRGLFKAFELKGNGKNHTAEASPVLQANPAALSRSVKFHESS